MGNGDIVNYLALRATNDLARKTAIQWLLDEFTMLAAQCNRSGSSIQISHVDDHRFRAGTNTMVGRMLTLKFGVRSLTVEAGWPRVPQDGIVKGGGLAQGHIRHFGRKSLDHELMLTRLGNGTPSWLAIDKNGERTSLGLGLVHSHVAAFLRE
jgi:hypothetical protein